MKSALVLSLGALALAAPTQDQSQGTTIAYSRKRHENIRRADGAVDWPRFMGSLKYSLLKYNPHLALPDVLDQATLLLKRDTDAEEELTDFTAGEEDEL
jgi:hypothetical protein